MVWYEFTLWPISTLTAGSSFGRVALMDLILAIQSEKLEKKMENVLDALVNMVTDLFGEIKIQSLESQMKVM